MSLIAEAKQETEFKCEKEPQKRINEEYKVWKKNSPFLYDLVMTHALEWPSLTVQWLPDKTSADEPNFLMIAKVQVPSDEAQFDGAFYDDETKEYGGFGASDGKFEIDIKICHPGEVNKARYMPHNPCVIATKTPSSDVLIFDYSRHPSKPNLEAGVIPDLQLVGHTKEGGIFDMFLGITSMDLYLHQPVMISAYSCIFDKLSCIDGILDRLVDRRLSTHSSPMREKLIVYRSIPMKSSTDRTVNLWDLRCLTQNVHSLMGHDGDIYQLQWSSKDETVLASTGTDRRVYIWDLRYFLLRISKIGDEQSKEDGQDGPPELLFIHGGHTSKVSDISWNANEPWMLTSVAEDNVIQFWQIVLKILSINRPKAYTWRMKNKLFYMFLTVLCTTVAFLNPLFI
ncbi:hypothetical protein MXB_3931 [Myxobolus squamalis]|nr:hypothetical protein MXB_3931 [Myxobolus squamalis]